MEEEIGNQTGGSGIIHQVIPDYLRKTNEEFAQVLLSLDEFQEKRRLIPYFSQYEYIQQREKMLEFWSRTIEKVMEKYYKSSVIEPYDLQCLFNFNGFLPLGLEKVICELAEDSNYSFISNKLKLMKYLNLDTSAEIQREEETKRQSLLEQKQNQSGIFSKLNPLNFFKIWNNQPQNQQQSSQATFEKQGYFISKKLLVKSFQKFKTILQDMKWERNHFASESEMIQNGLSGGLNQIELKLFVDLLEKEGCMKVYQEQVTGNRIIYYDKERVDKVNPNHFKNMSLLYELDINLQLIERDLVKYASQQDLIKIQFGGCLDGLKKKSLARENLIIKQITEQILNKKSTLIKNQLQIEEAINTKRVMSVISQGINAAKQNYVDISALENMREQLEENEQQEREIAQAFAAANQLSKEDEENIDAQLKEMEKDLNIYEDIPNIQNRNNPRQNEMEVEVQQQQNVNYKQQKVQQQQGADVEIDNILKQLA